MITFTRVYEYPVIDSVVYEDAVSGARCRIDMGPPKTFWEHWSENNEWGNDAELEAWLHGVKAKEIAYLAEIRVPVDERGKGLGTEMLEYVLASLDDQRFPYIVLHALAQPYGIGPSTEELAVWYHRYGFKVLVDGERQYPMRAVTMIRKRPTSSRHVR